MTQCPKGDHDIPDEDEVGARCDEHGVTLLWRGPPIAPEDLAANPHAPRAGFRPTLGTPALPHPR